MWRERKINKSWLEIKTENSPAGIKLIKLLVSQNLSIFHFIVNNINNRPGVDFTNILCAALSHPDPKNTKNTVKQSVFLALLGSGCIKAAHKMLVKLTLGMSNSNHLASHKSNKNCQRGRKSTNLVIKNDFYSLLSTLDCNF